MRNNMGTRSKEVAAEQRTPTYQERIVQDPQILVGKPVVKGTRISVELVLAKLAANPDVQELFLDYPRLTIDDVKACLAYAEHLVEQQDRATTAYQPTL